MKTTVYLRVAHDRKRRHTSVEANVRPNARPLTDSRGVPLPTIAFGIALNLPEELFRQAEQVIAELTIPDDQARVAAEVIRIR